ncbi:MAG: hypothetical protein JNM12_05375 [Alphaproteobacteria bacterium]|nr:hypothetical protein [Alphaproteobacteria bacterium]
MASTQQYKFEALQKFPSPPRTEPAKKASIETDAASLFALAQHYLRAAQLLSIVELKGDKMRWHPYRLNAAQAIELCLSAYLMQKGMTYDEVRVFQHQVHPRAVFAAEKGLVLRKRTLEHLLRMDSDREYLMVRYNPAPFALSELTRIKATLDELFDKTGTAFN